LRGTVEDKVREFEAKVEREARKAGDRLTKSNGDSTLEKMRSIFDDVMESNRVGKEGQEGEGEKRKRQAKTNLLSKSESGVLDTTAFQDRWEQFKKRTKGMGPQDKTRLSWFKLAYFESACTHNFRHYLNSASKYFPFEVVDYARFVLLCEGSVDSLPPPFQKEYDDKRAKAKEAMKDHHIVSGGRINSFLKEVTDYCSRKELREKAGKNKDAYRSVFADFVSMHLTDDDRMRLVLEKIRVFEQSMQAISDLYSPS